MIRLFVPDDLCEGSRVALSPDQAHYLLNVMRQEEGADIHLFNGRDGEWRARLARTGRREATAGVEARTKPLVLPPDVELLVALVKRARLEGIVEKATELGVRRVRLLTTRRTNAAHANLARLQAIATEAAEQTGRLDVPQVSGPESLETVLAAWPEPRRLMFCDEAGDDPSAPWGGPGGRAAPAIAALSNVALSNVVSSALPAGEPWAVLIGPEGGFDPAERGRLRALPSVVAVTLGPRILRADTAAVAALTLWQAALGDWTQG